MVTKDPTFPDYATRHAIIQFCDSVEAAIHELRRKLLEAPVEPKPQSPQLQPQPDFVGDLDKIRWAEAEGTHGAYLLAAEEDNKTNVVYKDLYEYLGARVDHKKFMGKTFLWIMAGDLKGIGRKTIDKR